MQKIKNIEILRFIIILLVVASHLGQILTNFSNIEAYSNFIRGTRFTLDTIDFFFIISGFFLFLKTDFQQSFISFAKHKLLRFMPLVLVVLLITFIVSLITPYEWKEQECLFTIFNLQGIGITLQNSNITPSWFVSALFWGQCFYFYLYKITPQKIFNLLTACIIAISYSIYVHVPNSWNIINYFLFINVGIIRTIAGIGVGYFIANIYKEKLPFLKNKINLKQKLFITGIEIYAFATFFYYLCFFKGECKNFIYPIILFIILFITFIFKKGYLSNILDNKISEELGKYTYSIFLTHYLVRDLWKMYIMDAHHTFVVVHPVINILSIYVVTIIVGIASYHLIEKRISDIIKRKYA